MADKSKIEWTDATWNPITGCTLVDEGCRNCYAAHLITNWPAIGNHPSRKGLARKNANGESKFTGEVRFNAQWLDQPLRWKKPRKIFVCAHGDLFHESVPDEWIDQIFAVMALAPQHTFQVLTKRPERAREYLSAFKGYQHPGSRVLVGLHFAREEAAGPPNASYYTRGGVAPNERPKESPLFHATHWPLPNLWLGTSISDQPSADLRIPELLATPAAVRFVSYEPALGPVDLACVAPGQHLRGATSREHVVHALMGGIWDKLLRVADVSGPGLDWVICGGESGPNARPMHPDWARSLRDQCAADDVPFLFKQWGEWLPLNQTQDGESDAYYHPAPARDPEASRRCKYDNLCLSTNGSAKPLGVAGGYQTAAKGVFSHAGDMTIFCIGKARAGRLLDGVEHNGFPGVKG